MIIFCPVAPMMGVSPQATERPQFPRQSPRQPRTHRICGHQYLIPRFACEESDPAETQSGFDSGFDRAIAREADGEGDNEVPSISRRTKIERERQNGDGYKLLSSFELRREPNLSRDCLSAQLDIILEVKNKGHPVECSSGIFSQPWFFPCIIQHERLAWNSRDFFVSMGKLKFGLIHS